MKTADFDYVAKLQKAQALVESKFVFKRFIEGTPLQNDIAVWMVDFLRENDASLSAYEKGIRDAAEVANPAGTRIATVEAIKIKEAILSLLTKPKNKDKE